MEEFGKCSCPKPEYCEKYQRHITGRLLQIVENKAPGLSAEKCAAYRSLWSRQARERIESNKPGIVKKAINFTKAVSKYYASGKRKVSEEQYKARLDTCAACPFLSEKRCLHKSCGCNIEVKAQWKSESCPLDKWPS